MQINQPNSQENQKFSLQGARKKEFLRGSERSSTENGDRKRTTNSYKRSSAEHIRTNYESRARSQTPGGENRSRDRSHESRAEQSKAMVSFEKEKCHSCSQRNHASRECKNCFECGSPNHFKRNFPYLNGSWKWQGFIFSWLRKKLAWRKQPSGGVVCKKMIKDKLIMALIDSGISVNIINDTLYKQLGAPSQIRMNNKNIIAANNGKMPVMGSADSQVQIQKFTCEKTVEFPVTRIEITPCLLGMEFLQNVDCISHPRRNELFCGKL